MKKLTIILAVVMVLAIGFSATSCKVINYDEDESTTTMTYDFTDFTEVEIGFAFKLEVIPSDEYSITIRGPQSLIDNLDVSKVGSRLKIEQNGWSVHFYRGMKATITMPVLEGLDISGAVQATAVGFSSDHDFYVEASGASSLDMDMETGKTDLDISGASRIKGDLTATETRIHVSGASRLDLEGAGGDSRLDISGASDIDLIEFMLEDVDIEISGASTARVFVNGSLDAEVSGASTLRYGGDPELGSLESSGGSSFEPL